MPDNNFFINKYKKNSNDKKPDDVEKIKFEKLEEYDRKKNQKENVSRKKLAAMFLIIAGPEKAREVVKSFSEEELLKITNEIINIDEITPLDVKAVEAAFGKVRQVDLKTLKGGKEFARNLLTNTFGMEKGGKYFIKTVEDAKESELAFLEQLPDDRIKDMLVDESDLIISVILSKLDPRKSAKILNLLPREMTVSVIKKMSGKLEITNDIYQIVLKKMKDKASEFKDDDTIKISGKSKLVEILKYSDSEQSEKIIQDIENENPELANEIKENIFTFNDVISLTRKDLEKALKNFPDKDLAYILKGTKDEIRNVFFTCISKRRRELIEDEMSVLGAVKKTDVDDKRKIFVNYLKDLEQKGKIVLKPDKDIYVD